VTKHVFHNQHPSIAEAAAQHLLLYAVALPGYWVATYYMDSLGRKNIQILGFSAMTVLYIILGILLHKQVYNPGLLMTIYALTFFFANFGPNSTTFILPSESYPQHVRASLNGFSAASGKAGAAIGTFLFPKMVNSLGGKDQNPGWVILICGIISLLGVIVTVVFVGDYRGKSMEGSSVYSDIEADPRNSEKQRLLPNVADAKSVN